MAGTALHGFRLRPGTKIGAQVLKATEGAPDQAEAIISNNLALSDDADNAIHALCRPGATVADTARGSDIGRV
jgi:hypothetical protein